MFIYGIVVLHFQILHFKSKQDRHCINSLQIAVTAYILHFLKLYGMQAISNWARQHTTAARLLLCILHTWLVVSAMLLCPLLAACHITVSFKGTLFVCVAGFSIVLATGYFRKGIHKRMATFRLQKLRFLLTGICCTILITGFYSSGLFLKFHTYTSLHGALEKTAKSARPSYESYDDKKLFYEDLKTYYTSLSKKELRKELRHELKNLAKKRSEGGDAALIALIVIGMLFALMAVAALSCTLACDGHGALAVLVGVGGAVGITWLAMCLVRSIKKKRHPLQEKPPPTTQ